MMLVRQSIGIEKDLGFLCFLDFPLRGLISFPLRISSWDLTHFDCNLSNAIKVKKVELIKLKYFLVLSNTP